MRHFARIALLAVLATASATAAFAGGAAATTGTRAEYLSQQGIIAQPQEIIVGDYIAAIDYDYADPDGVLGVYAVPGQYQLSGGPQELFVHVGIQAARQEFADAPPLNVAFVIDVSGSMSASNKIDWVRESLQIFAESVRDEDIISLVAFNERASVVMQGVRMGDEGARSRFVRAINTLQAGGNTNLYGGLELGFSQVMTRLSSQRANRIVLLSDGLPTAGIQDPQQFRELATTFRSAGVSITAVGLGTAADLALIRDVAHWSAGSSRFINNHETMEETFGSGIGRLLVPAAHEVMVTVRYAPGVVISETWGYDHTISGNDVVYTIPTLHSGDYETMVAVVQVPEAARPGSQRVATVNVSYRTGAGAIAQADPVAVEILRVSDSFPVEGVTNGLALRSATTLLYGRTLKEVGLRYHEDRTRTGSSTASAGVAESLLGLVSEVKQVIENTDMRLGGDLFAEEISTLANYQGILAGELQIAQEERDRWLMRYTKRPPVVDRSTERNVSLLMSEFRLSLASLPSGSVAILGFPTVGEPISGVPSLLATSTWNTVSQVRRFDLVSQNAVDDLLASRGVDQADLADVALAAELGQMLEVNFVVTGVTVVSAQTVYIFQRVIDVTTGEVVSAAQVMTPR